MALEDSLGLPSEPIGGFNPTAAPPGRLARLGVVLDASLPMPMLHALAMMSDRAGIDIVWLGDRTELVGDAWAEDAIRPMVEIAPRLTRARAGLLVAPQRRGVEELVARAREIAAVSSLPMEIGVLPPVGNLPTTLRGRTAAARLSAVVPDLETARGQLAVVDDIVLPGWDFGDLETAADEVRAEAAELGRAEPVGIGVMLPVSIGRTGAEAAARADGDSLFARLGHPAEIGIYGTLEECQDRVIALAHAGVTDLRCVLPGSADVHDVIAQLTAMTIGTTDVLVPGSLRSPAPPPPSGWVKKTMRT